MANSSRKMKRTDDFDTSPSKSDEPQDVSPTKPNRPIAQMISVTGQDLFLRNLDLELQKNASNTSMVPAKRNLSGNPKPGIKLYGGLKAIEVAEDPEDEDIRSSSRVTSGLSTLPTRRCKGQLVWGQRAIRRLIRQRVGRTQGPELFVVNQLDSSNPPLEFNFISESMKGEGVQEHPEEFMCGCECSGGCIDPECGCLDQMDPERREFPYIHDSTPPLAGSEKIEGTLRDAHLGTRDAIFECNQRCACDDDCSNKLVQWGRKLPLEIFKTSTRGWGLRCTRSLRKGEFLDIYRGEIVTEEECKCRDEGRGLAKDVYTFALDKFQADNEDNQWALDNRYVVDGEKFGGPTRFINHSCAPNLRQFTVSYNHADPSLYDLAFFAVRDVAAGEELTFDYVDKDVEEGGVGASKSKRDGMTRCLCRSENCRGYLWI